VPQLHTLTDPDNNTTTYTYNAIDEQTEVTSPSVNSASGESSTTEYDADGEVIETTDAGTNVEANGVMVATYTYNALGQRIGIKDNGTQTWTVYNGNSADANPYADFNSSGSLQTRYLDGLAVDQIFGQTSSSGSTEWYLTDQLGSVVAIASTSAVLDQITYDLFGNIVTQTNATGAVRFGFAGMEFDSVTGLYYDHARYYDAAIGRFTTQDPKGFAAGDTNLYRYVGNEPTSQTDSSGMQEGQPPGGGNGRTGTYDSIFQEQMKARVKKGQRKRPVAPTPKPTGPTEPVAAPPGSKPHPSTPPGGGPGFYKPPQARYYRYYTSGPVAPK
jgi:RHS repeat-associated protein